MGLTIKSLLTLATAIIAIYYKQWYHTTSIVTDKLSQEYDYIVVGAAGSVIAARLSEDEHNHVLLVEAGGHFEGNPLVRIPSELYKLFRTDMDWGYYTAPQQYSHQGFKHKRGYWPRGRVLGGSSTINGVHYTRGSRHDFDEWEKNGCEGWSYKYVLPYFLKSEDMHIKELKSSPYHSTGGPVAISKARVSALTDYYLNAGREMGYTVTDYNGKDQEGFNEIQTTVRNGVRSGIAQEYLRNTADGSNLHIAIRSFVTKIEIQNKRAVGVHVIRNGRKTFIKAQKEVIVSGGVINSPQLLLLSGIGPKEHLNELGIEVKADLPVGENLQDHVTILLPTSINQSLSIRKQEKQSLWTKLQYMALGQGPMSIGGSDGQAFLYLDQTSRGKHPPDIQLFMVSSPFNADRFGFRDDVRQPYGTSNPDTHGFLVGVTNTRSMSRGVIRLKTNDPFDHPLIDPRSLSEPEDLETLVAGIRLWERFIETKALKSLGAYVDQLKDTFPICSQHEFRSDAFWECVVRHVGLSCHHQCCTNKMGAASDPTTVVDPELRVKGISGLRVADVSVLPRVVSGNTQAPTVMIAEKISDMIRGVDTVEAIKERLRKDNVI